MNMLKPLTPSLLALALAACAVGPDYKTPTTERAHFDTEMQAKAYDRSRFESIWWKQFDDPVLNQLVQARSDPRWSSVREELLKLAARIQAEDQRRTRWNRW